MAAHQLGPAFAVLLTALLVPALAQANPGDLDRSFGGDGTVRTSFGNPGHGASAVAIDSQGRIVAAGDSGPAFAVARYRRHGSLDPSFGADGKVTTDFGGRAFASSVAIDSRGRIIAAGGTGDDLAMARYKPNGSLDASFSADGKATTDFGGVAEYASSAAIDSQGRIVTAVGNPPTESFALARYKQNGSLDASFGIGGVASTELGASSGVRSVAIDCWRRILAAGIAGGDPHSDFALARYRPKGSLDRSFGGDGKLTTDFGSAYDGASSVAIDRRGRIIAAGGAGDYPNNDFALARYNPDGSLDPSFGAGGRLTTNFVGVANASSVAIDSRRRIVVAGRATPTDHPDYRFALARYRPGGGLDRPFGGNGKVTTRARFGGASSVAIDSRNRIVAAGAGNGHFKLARYIGYPRRR